MTNKRIMSIDAETDGLWGNPFWVAAIVYEDNKEIDKINVAIRYPQIKEEWIKENVLPELEKCENVIFVDMYHEMLKTIADFYNKYKEGSEVLWHMGHIVESHLFREMHRIGFIGDWDAPYTPIEVSEVLRENNKEPDSVDNYIKKYNVAVNNYGSTHNPLYDCEVAFKAYLHMQK